MKQIFLFVSLFLIGYSLEAQLGIGFGFQSMTAKTWEQTFKESKYEQVEKNLIPNTKYFSLSWSNSKSKKRIRFSPSIGFSKYYMEGNYAGEDLGLFIFPEKKDKYRALFININPAFNWYALRKSNSNADEAKLNFWQQLKNDLFFQLSPSLNFLYTANNHRIGLITIPDQVSAKTYFSLKTGVGINFKIGDHFIVSPLFSNNYYPSVTWVNFGTPSPYIQWDEPVTTPFVHWYRLKSTVNQFSAALNIQFIL